MENIKVKSIKFEGGELLGVKAEDGKIYLGVKKTCLNIGLTEGQARRQIENVQEELTSTGKCRKFAIVQKEGERDVSREVLMIEEYAVPLWLAKISLTPKMKSENPKAIEKLLSYQLNAQKVLHEAFSLEILKDELSLQGEIVELKDEVITLREKVNTMISNSTINSYQAQKLNKLVRETVKTICGGVNSTTYKKFSRTYFKQTWLNLCDRFGITTYKDLNPIDYDNAVHFIKNWSPINSVR